VHPLAISRCLARLVVSVAIRRRRPRALGTATTSVYAAVADGAVRRGMPVVVLAVALVGAPSARPRQAGTATARGVSPRARHVLVHSSQNAGAGGAADTGSSQAYPRLASINAFKDASQVETFARYGLIIAPFSAADGAVQSLKARRQGSQVLIYVNTRLVPVPTFGGFQIYPKWWLTLAGTTLAAPLGAADTTIHVADTHAIAASLASNPDLLVDGETVHVTRVDAAARTLVVRRGLYSRAAAHVVGTRIAAHAVAWPGTWMLNVTRYCPVDPATGQTWVTYLAGQVTRRLETAPWDGIFYDDANARINWVAGGRIDANNDNAPDGADGPSGQAWPEGQAALLANTRALAPHALIIENGGYYPGFGSGRLFEHFPYFGGGWSQAFPSYLDLAASGPSTPPNVLNADTGDTGVQDLRAMRFGLGSALMGNGYYAYDYGSASHGQTWWYDEYDNGAGSSLVAGVDARATVLRMAVGTGRRFRVGDVVRAPSSVYTNAGLSLDDEQMRVVAVEGDTLRVARGVGGSLKAAHGARTKVMTAGQEAAGRGWLGRPLGPARARTLATPNLLAAGFGGSAIPTPVPWDITTAAPAMATLAREAMTEAHVSVTAVPGSVPWSVKLIRGTVAIAAGTPYTLSFKARGPAGQRIEALLEQTGAPYTTRASAQVVLDTSWRRYSVTVLAGASDPNLAVQFNLGGFHGDAWIDSVSVQQGDANIWRRDFTGGTALLNGTDATQTVELGPGYRHIPGTQDPIVNNGAPATSVTLAPHDAVLLVKVSVQPHPIPVQPGPRPLQRPCMTGTPLHTINACAPTHKRRPDSTYQPGAGHARSGGGPSASRPLRVPHGKGKQLPTAIPVVLALVAATIVSISARVWRHRLMRRG